ncbi:phosphoadenylyl-sulfate reductase [Rosettibacter firmus]|uniref:phosphoadenylyl-sulfate reductase n=1 Tax=Rosettibacter firmus TaxID=3111522 RepID=UPI00336C01FA
MKILEKIKNQLYDKDALEVLKLISKKFGNKAVFSTSLSIEDQVITHMLASLNSKIKIFTLDTGRLPNETYNLIERTIERYNIPIKIYFPNPRLVERMVNRDGINLFYRSIENRKKCCHVRKIQPLKRALRNKKVWITGLRKEQSITRQNMELVEYDPEFRIIKVNPLINWTEKEVWDYIKKYNIPYNSLYDKNYTSIGCEPCTRATLPGEDIRAGRWWWEHPETKECGLHIKH